VPGSIKKNWSSKNKNLAGQESLQWKLFLRCIPLDERLQQDAGEWLQSNKDILPSDNDVQNARCMPE